ncbi:hypothetical protein HPP92_019914 [Vanilla planifolia]|uniref:Uncharacterized protein n=1 Tax=Vanilla planifolia TaxID=51239 RepID=A0A835Q7N2_VANPL|nr:hypothetical protein HPP92_019914 [Vanilla planifolia]
MTFSLYLLRQRSISTTKLQEKQLQEFALLSRRCRRAQLDEKQESNAAVILCSRLRWRKRSCLRELVALRRPKAPPTRSIIGHSTEQLDVFPSAV